jgi:hypothetical protein
MAVLMPKKLQDFLDKRSGPSKNCLLEQDRISQITIERNTPHGCLALMAVWRVPPSTFLFLTRIYEPRPLTAMSSDF